jgi:hypothetical protein
MLTLTLFLNVMASGEGSLYHQCFEDNLTYSAAGTNQLLTSIAVPSTRDPRHTCLPTDNSILAKVHICTFKTKLLICIGQKAIVVYLSKHFLGAVAEAAFCQDSNQKSLKCKRIPTTIKWMH